MEKKLLSSIEASNMLGASKTFLKSSPEKGIYIPLRNLRREKMKCKHCFQEIKASIRNLKLSLDSGRIIVCEACSTSRKISAKANEKTNYQNTLQKSDYGIDFGAAKFAP